MASLSDKDKAALLQSASVQLPKERTDDPRIGSLLGKELTEGVVPHAALIGFPVDEGVKRNGGRPGASAAPGLVRQALFKLTAGGSPEVSIREIIGKVADWGDIRSTGSMESDQQALGAVVGSALTQKIVPIILGGGHETSYGHYLGYVNSKMAVDILNIDAHPDVRPLVEGKGHSGSPFRQILEHESGLCRHYAVAGLQSHACAADHLAYLNTKKAEYVLKRGLTPSRIESLFAKFRAGAMLSFDLDAVDEAHAPGVSAPCMGGLSVEQLLGLAANAGAHRGVTSCDIVEFNPQFDVDGRTARLAALTVWNFLLGLAERIRNLQRPRLGFG